MFSPVIAFASPERIIIGATDKLCLSVCYYAYACPESTATEGAL
jgi:hypothetical protein